MSAQRKAADPHDLQRFVDAQEDMFDRALAEVRGGAKQTHWIWFVFPQIVGLGHSTIAQLYAIRSLMEARAYLEHPLLGPRLREITAALGTLDQPDANRVFGPVDAAKLRSSLTLFVQAGGEPLYADTLTRWFGSPDDATLAILDAQAAR